MIEEHAFDGCTSLISILLSRNLWYIGNDAFFDCGLLDSVFLPPTVTYIDDSAFRGCVSLRFLYVPESIDMLGDGVFLECDGLLTTVKYEYVELYSHWSCSETINNDEVNQWVIQRYANLPFHQACFSTSVTPQEIEVCIQEHGIEQATEVDDQQMTALHILCANPHVTCDLIRTYLQLVPSTVIIQKYAGKTGLHILCTNPFVTSDAIRAYLELGPEAADEQDSDGMTPFQHLCRSDLNFLEERNFSSLMIWWYHCMPPQTKTGKKRKCGVTESI